MHFELADSRQFLERTAHTELASKFTFFYLDAHWYDDLPLARELSIIERHWQNFVAMVDDFRVPGDEGYGYDAYGPDKTLSLEYLQELLKSRQLESFFPAEPSSNETGPKRGCVVIARAGDTAARLRELRSLRPA